MSNRISLLKYRYLGSFVLTPDKDILAFMNTQPSIMPGEHWMLIAKRSHNLYFADSFGREVHSFLKQQYKQMMPEPLQSPPSVCGFYTIYAAFHFVMYRQETIIGFHDFSVTTSKILFSSM